jgi:repressor of nif and glnA expression
VGAALLGVGVELQPRTIRFHLLHLDRTGLTQTVSRRAGRVITRKGREELARANVIEKVGVISARVDALGYEMSFDLATAAGTVVVNTSLIYPEHVTPALNEMRLVFRHHLAISSRIILARPGETVGSLLVPEHYLGIGTVCSITVNGALLHRGIPVTPRFGGLVEVRDRKPVRFVELIEYRGSTLDPLEVFIKANMTRVRDVVRHGAGIVCAGFREVPAVALEDVGRVRKQLAAAGLGGILEIGKPNQPLLGIPVAEGHAGMIVVGGLNPVAAIQEAGIPVTMRSLAGLEDFARFRPVDEIEHELRRAARA